MRAEHALRVCRAIAKATRPRSCLLLAIVMACAISCHEDPSGRPNEPSLEETIDRLVAPSLQFGSPSGLLVGLTIAGERSVQRYANAEMGYALPRRDGLFEITAITKTITAILIAQLIADSLLHLDDPIQQFLPAGVEVPECDGHPIRIRHLLSHTAGLASLLPGTVDGPYSEQQVFDYLEDLDTENSTFCEPVGDGEHVHPGERMRHSEVGYVLLGMIAERVRGRPLGDLMRERVCDPLGLGDMRAYEQMSAAQRSRAVEAYEVTGERIDFWEGTWLDGSVGLASSIDDLLAYLEACMNAGGPLADAIGMTREPLFWNYQSAGDERGIAMAWSVFRTPGRQIFIQRGWRRMTCIAYLWPEQRTGMLLLATTREHFPVIDELAAEIWNEIEGRAVIAVDCSRARAAGIALACPNGARVE